MARHNNIGPTEGVVYVALEVTHEAEAAHRWKRAALVPLRDALRGIGDFDRLHQGDVDHVGSGIDSVADALALLDRKTLDGQAFFERDAVRRDARTALRGVITTWADYHELLFPLLYSAAAAPRAGAQGRLSVMGDLGGEVLIVLVDADADHLDIRSEDPQNLTQAGWEERIGGIASLEQAFTKWLKRQKKARRRREP